MTIKAIMSRLESLSDAKVRAHNTKDGAGDNQFGVKLGDIRKLAAELKNRDDLVAELWQTGNLDARLLAILLIKPKKFTAAEVEQMVKEVDAVQVADWLNAYVVKKHPDKEKFRQSWMSADPATHPWLARAGWSLTSERINKDIQGLDLKALLDRIETEMPKAPPTVQWTMNFCLAGIGINSPEHRERALSIGEKLGIYRDYPTSKGCTSPFAPIWIKEMVSRQS